MRTVRISFLLSLLVLLVGLSTANAEWVRLNTKSFSTLKDIFFQDNEHGWIVGTDGTIMHTVDGGVTWQSEQKFTTDNLLQIYFTDTNTGWLLCERNIYSRGRNATSYLRKTTDGGRNWEKIEFEEADRERVTKLLFSKNGLATAFGEGGIFYKLQEDGKTWKRSRAAIHFLLLDGAYSEALTGAIVGAGGTIVFTEDGGLTWENATVLGTQDTRINGITFTGPKTGWAVGAGGTIFSATGGGRLWRTQRAETTADLNDVFFKDPRNGWAVGNNGTLLQTTNGGQRWELINTRITHNLFKITFTATRGFAIGFGGTILATGPGITSPVEQKPAIRAKDAN